MIDGNQLGNMFFILNMNKCRFIRVNSCTEVQICAIICVFLVWGLGPLAVPGALVRKSMPFLGLVTAVAFGSIGILLCLYFREAFPLRIYHGHDSLPYAEMRGTNTNQTQSMCHFYYSILYVANSPYYSISIYFMFHQTKFWT